MKSLLVSAVLCLIVCALGEWATLALAGPVGSPSQCQRDTYWDPFTRWCEPCSQLCDDARDSQDACRENCSDWLDSKSEAKSQFIVIAVSCLAGCGWLAAIISTALLLKVHCTPSKNKKKDRKHSMEQHGEPRTQGSPQNMTPDLQMIGLQYGRPSSPVQVADDTPLSPTNMRSIHADATNTDDTTCTKPLLLVDAGNKTDEYTDSAQCELLAS